jgi:hypothetical protein
MLRAPKPHALADDELLATYANHFTITAACPCGHTRELFARPIQTMLGKGVLIGRVRECLRCHGARSAAQWSRSSACPGKSDGPPQTARRSASPAPAGHVAGCA